MKIKCSDGVTREFRTAANDGDRLPGGGRSQGGHEAQCMQCGELFGVHDTAVLKPRFVAHMCKPIESTEPDALVSGGGSIFQITPLSDAAKAWIDANVEAEGYMWMGSSLCVEHRYIADIVAGMQSAGLKVK